MPSRRGFRWDQGNSRLEVQVDGTVAARFDDTGTYLTLPTGNMGLVAGTIDVQDGGTVTQATNRSTGVTLSTHSGQVTTTNSSLAAVTIVTHTVTNTNVAATDVVVVSKVSGDVDTSIWVNAVAAGSFDVTLRNNHASAADTTALVYNFVVLKGATS